MGAVLFVLAALVGPWPARLADALLHGTPDDIAWVGREAGAAEVAAVIAIAPPDPVATRAATIAATAVDDGWTLLAPLAAQAAGWNRAAAVDATRAAATIARTLDGDRAIAEDIADDELAAIGARWLAIAAGPDRWPDVRVTALEIAARIARARKATADDDPGLGYDLAAGLADPDPALRRAAAELVPQPTASDWYTPLARAVINDPDPAVVVAAAQALCGDLAAGDPATTILTAIGPAGLERLRTVFTAKASGALPPGAVVDAARCLVADGTGPSRAAVAAVAAHAAREVRAALAKIHP